MKKEKLYIPTVSEEDRLLLRIENICCINNWIQLMNLFFRSIQLWRKLTSIRDLRGSWFKYVRPYRRINSMDSKQRCNTCLRIWQFYFIETLKQEKFVLYGWVKTWRLCSEAFFLHQMHCSSVVFIESW